MQYSPLDLENFETRFLEIEPSIDGIVRCKIRRYSLLEPPPYTALSYCWGDRPATQEITVDGQRVKVACGLEPALQQMRRDGVGLLWVDAISINQRNAEEKGYQVKWMDRIFSQASTVIAWLGKATPGSRLAFEWLTRSRERTVVIAWRDALRDLTNRSYWQRVWVIQEVAKGRNVFVQCGDQREAWEDIMPALAFVEEALNPREWAILQALRRFRKLEQGGAARHGRLRLRDALLQSRHSVSTDPRDMVYALLSLTSDGPDAVPFPNYRRPTEQIFTQTASYIIQAEGCTPYITLARRCSSTRLPSWEADWANLHGRLPPWIAETLNSSEHRVPLLPMRVPFVLRVRGLRLETIAYAFKTSDEPKVTALKIGDPFGPEKDCETDFFTLVTRLWSVLTMSQSYRRFTSCGRVADRQTEETDLFGMVMLCLDPQVGRRLHAWMENNGGHLLGGVATVLELLNQYRNWYRESRPRPARPGLMQDVKELLEDGLESMETFQMRVITNARNELRIAFREARAGDLIYWLEHCQLPLVLRRYKDGYQFVGELFPSNIGKDSTHIFWEEVGAIRMDEKSPTAEILKIY